MPRDDHSSLNKAFVQLHRRTRAEAPPFAVMRDEALHAMRETIERQPPTMHWLRISALGATACIVVALAWWSRVETQDSIASAEAVSPQKVEALLCSIERQFAVNDAIFDPAYPTDFLIANANVPTIP